MKSVYKFNCYEHTDEFLRLCHVSKDLYNQALYACLQALKEQEPRYLNYYDLNSILPNTRNLEGTINYRLLKAQVAQQTLKLVARNVKAYFKSIKDWKKNPGKYTGMPKMPNYLPRNGYFLLTYTNQCSTIKDGYIFLAKGLRIRIPQYEKYADRISAFQQIRALPRKGYTEIEIVYEQKDMAINNLDYNRYASIDLGLNNLATMVTDFSEPIIYSGRQLKSINKEWNTKIAKYKSILETDNEKKSSRRIRELHESRNNSVDDLLHKVSRHIVNMLGRNRVGNLVCGHNKGWKDSVSLGKVNNQNFVQIPHTRLIEMLRYKCERAGILFIENEEAHTSKCDALAREVIGHHDAYLGKRIKRGLFQSSTGRLLNADVNGALNILRKVVRDLDSILNPIMDSGWLFRPRKLGNLYCLGF